MPFTFGWVTCGSCHEDEDQHCPVCESCPYEPTRECCMEGWPEHLKEHERKHWAEKS